MRLANYLLFTSWFSGVLSIKFLFAIDASYWGFPRRAPHWPLPRPKPLCMRAEAPFLCLCTYILYMYTHICTFVNTITLVSGLLPESLVRELVFYWTPSMIWRTLALLYDPMSSFATWYLQNQNVWFYLSKAWTYIYIYICSVYLVLDLHAVLCTYVPTWFVRKTLHRP